MPSTQNKPSPFDTYWDAVDTELADLPARPVLEENVMFSNDFCTVYDLRLTSSGAYRIFGYYSVPKGDGPFPALFGTPRYGSVNHVPDYNDRLRYACLTLMHRGQRLADQPFAAAYPGLLTMGIDNPQMYIYRSIVADCLRGAEFLLSRDEIDNERVAIQGDDLAIITAARRPAFKLASVSELMFYRLMEKRRTTSAYPTEEVNDYLRAHPEKQAAVGQTLSCFEPLFHAPRVRATTIVSFAPSARESMQPLLEALGGPVEPYALSQEGGTDHDRVDAMVAESLGVEPLSRFRRTFA